jgi:putative nucleotidyltransferase with HDIG domain
LDSWEILRYTRYGKFLDGHTARAPGTATHRGRFMRILGKDVRDRVERINEIATLPRVMARILGIVKDPSSTALDLASEIANDQALTASILKTVNSAYYGFQRQIMTIPEAVVLLGFNEVERLALAITVINTLGMDRDSVKAMRMLWRHSLACSIVGSYLEDRHGEESPELRGVHVACLLHDIGKAVLAQHFPEAMPRVLQLVQEQGMTFVEAESNVLDGCTHAEIGAMLARRWDLPASIVESIEFHHNPDALGENHGHVHLTHLADYICNTVGFSSYTEVVPPPLSEHSSALFNYSDDVIDGAQTALTQHKSTIGAITSGVMM